MEFVDLNYKISIILPVYNVEKHIHKALNSIIRQTIGSDNLQVIMVDDLSTDDSGKIIDEYAEKYENFTSIHLNANSGAAGKPRNLGMEIATADFIMFLDPDDYFLDDACEILYNKISTENVDIVFGNYSNFHKGKILRVKTPFGSVDEVKVKSIHEEVRLLNIPPSIWTKIFKSSFLKDNMMRFHEKIPGQDLVFVVDSLLKAKGIIFLNNFIVCNRNLRDGDDDKSITYSNSKNYVIGLIQAYNYLYEIFKTTKNEKYIPIVFNSHIPFWMHRFVLSNLETYEKKEVISCATTLFKKLSDSGLNIKQKDWQLFFDLISNRKYDESILISKFLLLSLKREQKLRRNLKNKQSQVAKLQTVKGWTSYKFKNILFRLKTKFNN
jgi:glycosyltransferase involved in cell wall biosynthesis